MRAAISLLVLLLSMCGARTRTTRTEVQAESQGTGSAAEVSTQLDISAELKELSDMVVELRVMLRYTQEDVKVLEADNVAMKQRLAASETDNIAMKQRLAVSETEVEAAPKVAFSAGLGVSGSIESGSYYLDLVFSRVITNVGQAYSSKTGFFTAPVSGVYYFRFTVMDKLDTRYMAISMCKNGVQLMWLSEHDTDGQRTYLSSGLTLQLEKGDVVNLVLPTTYRLHDTSSNHSTFSGFLLFPL
ncbi:complement C1q tumor necrosis factor-related protein 3-like [Engraulis encrasicolus]|uniref:complement C1q tumor necrosis factor-related protein 3-like n=1 Tax=Engraulis encrasicolus TaxID=184585 RepID=UPI002FD0C164